jgi:cellulose synthase/poly-beta-1,6-N-acetylglucosamine synthase-like glycosyltransferase
MLSLTLPIASMLVLPLVLVLLDLFGGLRARHKRTLGWDGTVVEDFEVLVPIWGSIRYLENVDYLSAYGSRVVLCTTASETPEFNAAVDELARIHGFRVFRAEAGSMAQNGTRSTSGTLRDRVVRDAHEVLSAPWVVCIDADTVTEQPLSHLVGAMASQNVDFASVRLVPSNADTLLARLQGHEYAMAMLLRRIMPWMVSGACHAARRHVHKRVMAKHSLFFQGNDIEVGLLADRLGYTVGHVPFDVPTTVPATLKPWLRQRLAWAGGEVRLFVANPQIMLRHPFFWAYGALISLGGLPLRWYGIAHLGWILPTIPVLYVAILSYLQRGRWNWLILLMPFYAAVSSLLLTPIGLVYYVKMAIADKNAGLIRIRRHTPRLRPRFPAHRKREREAAARQQAALARHAAGARQAVGARTSS